MENQIGKKRSFQLVKGIVLVILAILVLMSPGGALLAWAVYIGIGMLVAGIVITIQGYNAKGILENWGWRVFEGILDIFIGFMLLANPAVTASVLPFVIGFWGSFYGVMLVVDAFAEKGGRGVKIISGILVFLLSTGIMFNPLLAGLSIAIWFGIILLVAGIFNVIDSLSSK